MRRFPYCRHPLPNSDYPLGSVPRKVKIG